MYASLNTPGFYIGSSQTTYKAVINDTTLASTLLFTVNLTDAMTYNVIGEMSAGFAINGSGAISTTQQLNVGRYEFVIIVLLPSSKLSFLIGLVDVLSTSRSILYSEI